MKTMRRIVADVKAAIQNNTELTPLLWQLICHSPQMPLWLPQKELLAKAETGSLKVFDQYFTQRELNFNYFIWGEGRRKIMLTHGWASKAADFIELINALLTMDDVQVIAFDAPGNGKSEGALSNLLLYVEAVKALLKHIGTPEVMIAHSLGAMANVIALNDLKVAPRQLISITPLIRVKENFKATMNSVGVPEEAQEAFFEDFRKRFDDHFSHFRLTTLYNFKGLPHFLAYDEEDHIAPFEYLQEFLSAHPDVKSKAYNGAGHDRILKNEEVIADVLSLLE
ncbi:alpha/beta hydrolase [Mucilaginibacter sp. RS28]|uniref:Alpha/beta hydrolase n=1 Tax=Mucilaginibacter straminoryzae TaxID=2932774 RepID=A0A9X1X0T0_9SPHI|nr:alpha/beta hydrolase [Mucilaginibacter straminoryzae]MCJ8208280.1 alpha/beta hydrolase [Mucilaginibacter straminoryzae]